MSFMCQAKFSFWMMAVKQTWTVVTMRECGINGLQGFSGGLILKFWSTQYLNVTLTKDNNITTGKVYKHVIEGEVRPFKFRS